MKNIFIISAYLLLTSVNLHSQESFNDYEQYFSYEKKEFTKWDLIFVPEVDSFQTKENTLERALFQPIYKTYPQRPFYNNTFRIDCGYSINTARVDQSMRHYNDTSEHKFDVVNHTPIISFFHSIRLDSTFALGYSFGYSQSEIYYDNQAYGDNFYFVSIHPQLYACKRYNFEYYVKLNVGVYYLHNELDMVKSDILQRTYPTGFKMFTGFTFAGINYLINDHIGLNAEFSIWSHQSINMGISYRFLHHKRQKQF